MASHVPDHLDDVHLATAAAGGSVAAWHEFVSRYSGLIVSVVRRYLKGCDEDDWRNAYVETLEHFYSSGLAQYDGEAALSTWVITVARSRCLDMVRARHGRRREPPWLQALSDRDRTVYRLYFVESMDYAQIHAWFRGRSEVVTQEELIAIVERLDEEIDPRVRMKIAYELRARSVGAASGRLLEFLDALRMEAEQRAETLQPDYELFEAQTRDLLASIGSYVERLPEPERRVVDLHFFHGLPASRVAADLDLPNSRRAYTLVGRALQQLRKMIDAEPTARNGHGRPTSNGDHHLAERRKGRE